ncbi:MAG: arsenate reductase ArsC [Candidatus Zixiibacteriota bacterium]
MKILVLCTGNSCRSQMAEGFFRHYFLKAGDNESAYAVRSAGLEPHGLNPMAVRVMAEAGIDISGHSSDHLDKYAKDKFDYVITVCDNAAANCPVFPGKAKRLHWPFDDPAKVTGSEADILTEFRRIRDEIEGTVRRWLSGLDRLAPDAIS